MSKKYPKEKMSPRQRFMDSLERKKVDRIPVVNPTSVVTVESMKAVDIYFPNAHLKPEMMADLASTGYELIGFDTISPYFSVQQEAAALGCHVEWGTFDSMPEVRGDYLKTPEEIKGLDGFLNHSAMKVVVDALKILKKEYKDHVCLVGKVMGPWTLSYHLYGVQNFLMDTILNPDKVRLFLEKLKVVSIMFANEQFKAGADIVTLADHLTGDLAGPETYRDFLMPVHEDINKKVNGPLILHTCGRTTDRMNYISSTGFSAFHFDSKNDLTEAIEMSANNKLLLIGDISNETLLRGKPGDVRKDVREAIDAGIRIIAPECAIPLYTPNENLKAIVEEVREYCFN